MGKLSYRSTDGTQEVSIEVDEGSTTYEFIEDGVAPLMYGMGYFPTNVADALGLEDTIETMLAWAKRGVEDELC